MTLNFVAKVWDETYGDYRPIYIAPDATDAVRGDVYLSDATNGTDGKTSDILDAAKGVTAATPKAVKTVYDAAIKNNVSGNQTIQSNLNPTSDSLTLGTAANKWGTIYANTFDGKLKGNADTASKLQTPRKITVQNAEYSQGAGSVSFDGDNDVTIKISGLDASSLKTGTVPIDRLPQGALERLVHVADQAARFKLTKDTVQLGDTVQQDDTGVMYVVVDENNLANAKGYVEYTAGTAVQAQRLEPGATIQTALGSDAAVTFKGDSNITPGVSGTLPIKHGGTNATTTKAAQYNLLNDMYVGDDTFNDTVETFIMRHNTPSAENGFLKTKKPAAIWNWIASKIRSVFGFTTDNILSVSHGGTGTSTGKATGSNPGLVPNLPSGSDTEQMFLNGNNEWKKVVTEIADGSITTAKLANSAVTTVKIADAAVDLTKLGIDVETVHVGNTKPTDDNVTLWINPSKDSNADLVDVFGNMITQAKTEVLTQAKTDLYPVGTVIRSKKSITPSQIYGGTWELSSYHDFQGIYIYTKTAN